MMQTFDTIFEDSGKKKFDAMLTYFVDIMHHLKTKGVDGLEDMPDISKYPQVNSFVFRTWI